MKHKILIVEDEPAIVDTIQYALETDGFDPKSVSSGEEALAVVASLSIDLIVLDIGLPDISGLELLKTIREKSPVPIIFLTARAEELDKVVGLEIGADDYITKPFSPRELTARIKAVLRRTDNRLSSSEGSHNSAFHVLEEKCTISYFDSMLELSRYEYLLLSTLLKRPGTVFSRNQLMDLVWDEPDSSMDRTVDAHIKNLRAKLKRIKPELDPIITHRGLGYSLKEGL